MLDWGTNSQPIFCAYLAISLARLCIEFTFLVLLWWVRMLLLFVAGCSCSLLLWLACELASPAPVLHLLLSCSFPIWTSFSRNSWWMGIGVLGDVVWAWISNGICRRRKVMFFPLAPAVVWLLYLGCACDSTCACSCCACCVRCVPVCYPRSFGSYDSDSMGLVLSPI